MDRKIEKKTWNSKRIMTIAGITVLAAFIVYAVVEGVTGKNKLDVDVDRLTISTITKGTFREDVPVNGDVMPLTTINIDATDGGRVEQKYVEDGAMLKAGDPIVRLSSTDLELQLAQAQTSVINDQIQMNISNNNAEQNTVTKKQNKADVDLAYNEAERVYKLDKDLYAKKAIGSQEYQTAVNNYNYQVEREKLARQFLAQDSITVRDQKLQNEEQLTAMKATLELLKKKIDLLTVRAPVAGELTAFDSEIGQDKKAGDQLGQIDVQTGFKVRASIEQHYLNRVYNGLKGDFEFDNKTYNLVVKKVFQEVVNGQFSADMYFVGPAPTGIRKGQTLQVRLFLSDPSTALLLPRGGFFQQTGGNWIFKLSKDGKTAYKTDIQINRQSPDYFELTSGLQEGDQVITSSYETFGNNDILVLKK